MPNCDDLAPKASAVLRHGPCSARGDYSPAPTAGLAGPLPTGWGEAVPTRSECPRRPGGQIARQATRSATPSPSAACAARGIMHCWKCFHPEEIPWAEL